MKLTDSKAWKNLRKHSVKTGNLHLAELFAEDRNRFEHFSLREGNLLFDYSKQRVSRKTIELLCELARATELNSWIEKLFTGDRVNNSENRAALHTALRLPAGNKLMVDGEDIVGDIHDTLERMEQIVNRVHAGQWRGFSGRPVDTIVNIGVGGSDLGPFMASKALTDPDAPGATQLEIFFVSTMDGSQIVEHLDRLNPATTLFIISSKSFTTIDTLSNANTALQWLRQVSGADDEVLFRRHFIGVSANNERMADWGIPPNSRLALWDWIGGRYSMWSAIGLPIALEIGMDGFRQMLAGAHQMDQHFRTQDFEKNLPVMLAMIGIWNINFLNIRAHAILPYDGRMGHLPAYLGQLEMESNGKSVSRDGASIDYNTCPILWGEIGPNAQHAFYQLLHQGTESVMCDFVVPARRYQDSGNPELQEQHKLTLANCLAQSRILALGDTVIDSEETAPVFKRYRGNQPSTTLLLDELTPFSFGQLIALYEHKVFVQSVIWNINPFDQWGVELGKEVATTLTEPLSQSIVSNEFDSSTNGLLKTILEQQDRDS
ncbi:MAG: glucose-6-phosphate isomerase [Gammaproteobacteria bacterium]|jgi:glucose-6-phosphate isomerase|nr:glucose-6-phosphate isomerase [Gammaproteobacteria bacterium]